MRCVSAWGLAVLLGVSSCATASETSEDSVRPGVNDKYSEPGALDRWKAIFESETREVSVHRAAIVVALSLRSGDDVVDVGAGTGLLLEGIADAIGETGTLYAADVTPQFLAHLRERARSRSNVRVVEATVHSLGLEPEVVDVAVLCDVYHHLEYPATYMKSVRAALRPGGRLVVVDFERIPGVTSEAMLKHVRAGRSQVVQELLAAGFREPRVLQIPGLEENYALEMRR